MGKVIYRLVLSAISLWLVIGLLFPPSWVEQSGGTRGEAMVLFWILVIAIRVDQIAERLGER